MSENEGRRKDGYGGEVPWANPIPDEGSDAPLVSPNAGKVAPGEGGDWCLLCGRNVGTPHEHGPLGLTPDPRLKAQAPAEVEPETWPEIPADFVNPLVFRDANLGIVLVSGPQGDQTIWRKHGSMISGFHWCLARKVDERDGFRMVDALNRPTYPVPIPGTIAPKLGAEPLPGGSLRPKHESPEPQTKEENRKSWKAGDRVCFAHQPLGPAHTVTRLVPNTEMLELDDLTGAFARTIFVPAPAEPVTLPPIEVEPKKNRAKQELTRIELERFVATLDTPLQDAFTIVYGAVLSIEDTLTNDFQVASGMFEAVRKVARNQGLCSTPDPEAHPISAGEIERLRAEVARLTALINTPEIVDFVKAVQIEAVHQRERWPADQDAQKSREEWFWTLGYLAGKALAAQRHGDPEKFAHHLISSAALLCNWHAHAVKK